MLKVLHWFFFNSKYLIFVGFADALCNFASFYASLFYFNYVVTQTNSPDITNSGTVLSLTLGTVHKVLAKTKSLFVKIKFDNICEVLTTNVKS